MGRRQAFFIAITQIVPNKLVKLDNAFLSSPGFTSVIQILRGELTLQIKDRLQSNAAGAEKTHMLLTSEDSGCGGFS
jgi:hypothetical protein